MASIKSFAIVLFGQLRTFEKPEIGESYFRYLKQYGPIDVFISCWDDRGCSSGHGNVVKSQYEKRNDKIEISHVKAHYEKFDFFNIKGVNIENFDIWVSDLKEDARRVYFSKFHGRNDVTTPLPAQYTIERGTKLLSSKSEKEYDIVYFLRPDCKIVDSLTIQPYNPNIFHFNHINSRCIDWGFYSSSRIMKVCFSDIYERYMENVETCKGVDTGFNHEHDNRDNNNMIRFHITSKSVEILHNRKPIFAIVRL